MGLAAGQIAQEYGRPTVLLSSDRNNGNTEIMARGSARSVNGIDLYQLVKSQSDLLHRFGGHPFAAGLSLPLSNLDLFREGMNQQLKQKTNVAELMPQVDVDLVVTVADLGRDLFEELRQLEPYGMGNPIPKLLIKNCWFKNAWNKNIQDSRGKKIQYIKTTFYIWDDSVKQGFPGLWWGHYKDELPVSGRCDAIAELDFNTFSKRYEIRLISLALESQTTTNDDLTHKLIDRRSNVLETEDLTVPVEQTKLLQHCPDSWSNIRQEYRQAVQSDRSLVLAYSFDELEDLKEWQQLVGIAKFLSRTQKSVTKAQIQAKLNIGDRSFDLGLKALTSTGFQYQRQNNLYQFSSTNKATASLEADIKTFLAAVKEARFQQQYFYRVPLPVIAHQLET